MVLKASTETIRLIRDGMKADGGRGYGGGGRGRLYTCRYTVTTTYTLYRSMVWPSSGETSARRRFFYETGFSARIDAILN